MEVKPGYKQTEMGVIPEPGGFNPNSEMGLAGSTECATGARPSGRSRPGMRQCARTSWIQRTFLRPEGRAPSAAAPPTSEFGFKAISRWLSTATPPENGRNHVCIPEGCQRGVTISCAGGNPAGRRSLRDRFIRGRAIRGYRVAQPPANGWHPSGMARTAQAGARFGDEPEGFPAISRWLRSAATTPPVTGGMNFRIPEGCQPCPSRASRVDGHLKQRGAVWQ